MVDAGDPFAPKVGDPALDRDEGEHGDHHHDDEGAREKGNRLVEGNGAPGQLAEHVTSPSSSAAPGLVSAIGPRSRRQRLIQDLLEQSVGDRLERERLRLDALLGQLDIARRREVLPLHPRLAKPLVEFRRGFRHDLKMHVGESVAADLGGEPAKRSGIIGGEEKLRAHAIHGVDHAAELGSEESGHHASRGQRKVDRDARGDHQAIDAGDVLIGVDEQPFPVERHDLNVERLLRRLDRLRRIEIMRPYPRHAAQKHDRQERDRPDDQFERTRVFKVGQILRPGVGRSKPPRDGERGDDRRDHDREHDRDRIDQDLQVGVGDRALRIEHAQIAAAEKQGAAQRRQFQKSSAPTHEDHGPPRPPDSLPRFPPASRSPDEPKLISIRNSAKAAPTETAKLLRGDKEHDTGKGPGSTLAIHTAMDAARFARRL